ncbi:MAG TPA: FUSC family protein [Jatrophihabitans sp.]|nr:FUSC family protein [Jatrophihabitans sp.]
MSESRSAAVLGLLRDAARLDRTQSDPVVSLRNAIGVAAPLAIGILSGGIAQGLASTVGALQAAFADRPGPYRLRILRMLGTALAAGVTSGLAVLASRSDAASVVLLLVLALVAGLLLSGGPSATQVGVAGTAAALVLGHISRPPSAAWEVAVLVFAGGALQTLLAIAAWPLGRHRPERVALAGLYRELAVAARRQQGSRAGPPAGDVLGAARQTLYGLGHDHGPSVEAYRVLLDEGERIRRELVVLTAAAERLAAERNAVLGGLVRGALTATASVLDEIAEALAQPRAVRPDILDAARARIQATAERLAGATAAPGELTRRAAAARLDALAGQLRAAVESTRAGASEGGRGEPPGPRGVGRLLRDPIAILRANLSPESAVLRHAVRLAVLVAGSDLALRLAEVYRGYWVPLTLLVVLRPDFAATLQRAVMRVAGTIVGLLAATVLVHWVPGGAWWQVLLIAVLAFGMRFAGPGNVALSAVCLSGLVVVLLEINGVSAHTTVVNRAFATLGGGALAVLATLALPAWERRFVPGRLAELLTAYRNYLDAVADPDTDRGRLQRTRTACRLARSNAQASVDRARSEPVRGQAEVELGRTVLAHSHRFIHAMMSVDAVRVPVRDAGGSPELTDFLAAAGEVLDALATALRDGTAPAGVPRLRPREERLAERLSAAPERVGGAETVAILIEATDRITNSLDTLLEALRRRMPKAPAPAH